MTENEVRTNNPRPDHIGGSAATAAMVPTPGTTAKIWANGKIGEALCLHDNADGTWSGQWTSAIGGTKIGSRCTFIAFANTKAPWTPLITALKSTSPMVIDGKDAAAPEARTWPNLVRWVATLAVIAAERAYWKAVDDYRVPMPEVHHLHAVVKTKLDALDAVEKRPDFMPRPDCTRRAECKETGQCQAQSICP